MFPAFVIWNHSKLVIMCKALVQRFRDVIRYLRDRELVYNESLRPHIPPCILGVYEKSTQKGTHFGPRGCFFYRFFAPADHSFLGVISMVWSSASSMLVNAPILGCVSPASMAWIVLRETPERSASSRCVNPFCLRSSCILAAMVVRMSVGSSSFISTCIL